MMPITDATLRGRSPRSGTITLGRTYLHANGRLLPKKESCPVFHTSDIELAMAIKETLGGVIYNESEEYECDVVIGASEFDAYALPAMFEQWLESWRIGECLRRCDGEQMLVCAGERLSVSIPCACEKEMEKDGVPRECTPHTSIPVLVPLAIDRYAPWTLKATSWSSAQSLKGSIHAIQMAGLSTSIVPVTIRAKKINVRNPEDGELQTAHEFEMQINISLLDLPELLASGTAGQLSPPALTPDAALAAWNQILSGLEGEELDHMRSRFRDKYGSRRPADLTDEEMIEWVQEVRSESRIEGT